ncbi:70_t:CDS:2, partial [Racocetra fulgida]
ADTFLRRASISSRVERCENEVIDTVDYLTLNENQKKKFKQIEQHYEKKQNRTERNQFSEAMFILPKWSDIDAINIDKLGSLNCPIAKILAVYTGDQEAKKADFDVAKGLESQLLLAT